VVAHDWQPTLASLAVDGDVARSAGPSHDLAVVLVAD
jgi:hypothetical protein